MSPPAKAPSADPSAVDVFLRATVRSGLLDTQQLQQALNGTPSAIRGDAQELANHLVKVGHLSRFQAHKLLQGVSLGLVLGPYHVLAQIGRGGMGAVYLARDTRNQGLVAVKVLPPKRAKAQERMLARFRREMEICQRVSHPNLTRTFEVGVHQGVNYIAMEYIPGKNLYRLVHERGHLEVSRAARLICEVAEGLEYAHAQGLIHRDLKPSNLLITPADHAKVLDLGLALIQGELAEEKTIVGGQGYVVGTMDYLAPEQAEDPLGVDARSDIYALGCTLYFALTGQPPFPGGNALQKMLRHRTEEPVPVRTLQPYVPAAFEALVQRMMAKDPNQRFANASEVRAALLPWIGEAPAAPTPAAIRPAPPPPPQPIVATKPLPPPQPILAFPPAPHPVLAFPPAPNPPPKPAPVAAAPPAIAAPPPAIPPAAPSPAATAPPRVASAPIPAPIIPPPAVVPPSPPVADAPPVPLASPVEWLDDSSDGAAVFPSSPAPPDQALMNNGGMPTMKIRSIDLPLILGRGPGILPPPAPDPPPVAASPFAFDDPPAATAPPNEPPAVVAPMAQVAIAPFGTLVPERAAAPEADVELPFWLDYLLPVGGASLFLFIAWVMVLAVFIR
jgi:serine/threonine protein kinase